MTSRYIRQISQQEDLLVVLNADHLGTFSIEGFDVAWRSGGEEGTYFRGIGITLHFDHAGPDPGLRDGMYGPA